MSLTRKGFGLRAKQGLVSLLMTVGMMVGISVATAAPAQAAGTTYIWPINHTDVCNRQGHFGATSFNWGNPYSLLCYDVSIPAGITLAGGLDMNGYCQSKYWGSRAELWGNTIMAWKCVRRA
ncbi:MULTISPECIES: hypothetical protein [Streptomyces]|uniref:Secreted protein n=1 Tax=Streptomyces bobili TaxID=67280 RepID=A0ABZ1R887_9ACTN|nr:MULTISPECIES: hypothetical protein [Streptomyces]